MECITILEREIVDLRKTLAEKEKELYEIKKKWVSRPQLDNHIHTSPNGPSAQVQMERLPRWAIERYSRQILLPDIGVAGQAALLAAKVLVVGAGGLGCPAAAYLAGAGVGVIGIVDYDTVDLTNIHRQLLHTEGDQGVSKVLSAADALRRINSNITITPHETQLSSTNALDIINRYHLVLDCTDNVPTRYLLNDACALTKLPLISGSALKMEGQLTIYGYQGPAEPNEKEVYRGPCYRCLFPAPPPPATVGSCAAHGVAGPVPGLIGVLQALEAIKLIVGQPYNKLLVERMLIFDGDDCTFRTVRLRPRTAGCAACSAAPSITSLLDYETFCKTKAKEKKKADARGKSQRRKEEKEKRMSGQSYYGFRRDRDRDKWVQDVLKQERTMGPPCSSPYCAKGTARKCPSFGEEERAKIFDYFWNELDWTGKKNFVRSLVDRIPAKRRRLKHKGEVSRKGDSSRYHLLLAGARAPVCRATFLRTLGIKEAMLRCWLAKEHRPKQPKRPIKALNVESYIDSLPKAETKCPYCKSTSTYSDLLYIDMSSIKNQYQLYNHYVKEMNSKGVVPASRKTFAKVFLAKNLKIFKPKNESDVCDAVSQHNVVNGGHQLDGLSLDLGQNVMNMGYAGQCKCYAALAKSGECTLSATRLRAERPQGWMLTDLDLDILSPSHRITASELAALLSRSHMLIDVRSAPEFGMCRIDGAVNYPIDSIRGQVLDKLLEEIRQSDCPVTFICRRGNDSQLAARLVLDALAQADEQDGEHVGEHARRVTDVVGGLHAWARLVDNNFPVY